MRISALLTLCAVCGVSAPIWGQPAEAISDRAAFIFQVSGDQSVLPPLPWITEPTRPPTEFSLETLCDDCRINPFSKHALSVQVLTGYYSKIALGPTIPAINYVPIVVRINRMLNEPTERSCALRGNWEQVFEFIAAGIPGNVGNYFAGPTGVLKIRRNFLPLGWKVVPYIQAGTGFIFNDAYKNRTQRAIGEAFEFHHQLEIGVRCFLSTNWSLDLEVGYQHISNAGLSARNLGLNAAGATFGFTYQFPTFGPGSGAALAP